MLETAFFRQCSEKKTFLKKTAYRAFVDMTIVKLLVQQREYSLWRKKITVRENKV